MFQASVLILCVHYKNTEEVRRFIKAVAIQGNNVITRVLVVDNSGELLSQADSVISDTPACTVEILSAGRNIGYYGAATFALDYYLQSAELPDWVIVCNTDINFVGKNFFARLFALHDRNAALIISPRVVTDFGEERFEFTIKRPSQKSVKIYLWILEQPLLSLLYHVFSLGKVKSLDLLRSIRSRIKSQASLRTSAPFNVYAPAGSFTCFSRGYFKAGGNFNHGAFLYGEEVFVAETARRIGGQVLHDPRLTVIHQGFSTTNVFRSPQVREFKRDAVRYYYDTFFKE